MPHGPPISGGYFTVAQCIKEGIDILARCRHCDREARVDKQALVLKRGADFKPGEHFERFSNSLKCTACGLNGAKVEFRATRSPPGAYLPDFVRKVSPDG